MLLHPLTGSPTLAEVREVVLPFAVAPAVRPAGLAQRARVEAESHQLRNPGRVGRRQQGREAGAALPPEHGRTLDARLIHDDQDVVHHHLQRRKVFGVEPVGQANTAPVQDHDTGEGAQPGEHPPELGQLPVPVQVRDETRDAHEIDGSCAEDLIRDRDVAVVRVAHIGAIPHRGPPASRLSRPPSLATRSSSHRSAPRRRAGISARTSLRSKWSSVSRDDTYNRHQQAWMFLYSGGRWERSMPGHRRCWTLWPCFASRCSRPSTPAVPHLAAWLRLKMQAARVSAAACLFLVRPLVSNPDSWARTCPRPVTRAAGMSWSPTRCWATARLTWPSRPTVLSHVELQWKLAGWMALIRAWPSSAIVVGS